MLYGRSYPPLPASNTLARTPEHTSPKRMSWHAHTPHQSEARRRQWTAAANTTHNQRMPHRPDGCRFPAVSHTRHTQSQRHTSISQHQHPAPAPVNGTHHCREAEKGPPKYHGCATQGHIGFSDSRGLLRSSSSDPRYRYVWCVLVGQQKPMQAHRGVVRQQSMSRVFGGRSSLGGNQRPPGTHPSNVDTCTWTMKTASSRAVTETTNGTTSGNPSAKTLPKPRPQDNRQGSICRSNWGRQNMHGELRPTRRSQQSPAGAAAAAGIRVVVAGADKKPLSRQTPDPNALGTGEKIAETPHFRWA